MRVRKSSLLVPAILALILGATSVSAQKTGPYPPFTVVMQRTDQDAAGVALTTSVSTTYHSASGDWRIVSSVGGYEVATLYLRGRGVYVSNARTGVMVKLSNHAPGCPLRTAEQLRSDPKFTRTETVLGFTAYVWAQKLSVGYLEETFWVPELGGGTPFKRITSFHGGRKIIDEPLSVTLGEPAAIDVSGPSYPVIEQQPIFNRKLETQIQSKPDAVYPAAALRRGVYGTVYVRVIIDQNGRILHADSNTPLPFLTEAAIEAAYQASFSPTLCNGEPVVSTGTIVYEFLQPRL